MQPQTTSPLPRTYRFRADTAACFAGVVAVPLSAFFLPTSPSNLPFGVGVLLLVSALAASAAFAAASISKVQLTNSSEAIQLLRCGARAALLGAMLAASMTVLGNRLFGSKTAALLAVIPSALSILPAAFFGILAAAVATGLRLPKFSRPASGRSGGPGVVILLIFVFAAGFLSAVFP